MSPSSLRRNPPNSLPLKSCSRSNSISRRCNITFQCRRITLCSVVHLMDGHSLQESSLHWFLRNWEWVSRNWISVYGETITTTPKQNRFLRHPETTTIGHSVWISLSNRFGQSIPRSSRRIQRRSIKSSISLDLKYLKNSKTPSTTILSRRLWWTGYLWIKLCLDL